MSPQEFVDAIRLVVTDAAISDTVEVISSPPGKKPSKNLMDMSSFYNSQNESGKIQIEEIIRKSVEEAVFGFFCVIDGVRAIETRGDKGTLSLTYEKDVKIKLNADSDLHDRYNS